MALYEAKIIARPKYFRCLVRATVVFNAANSDDADEQAQAYADRLGMYDAADVDSVHEIGGP